MAPAGSRASTMAAAAAAAVTRRAAACRRMRLLLILSAYQNCRQLSRARCCVTRGRPGRPCPAGRSARRITGDRGRYCWIAAATRCRSVGDVPYTYASTCWPAATSMLIVPCLWVSCAQVGVTLLDQGTTETWCVPGAVGKTAKPDTIFDEAELKIYGSPGMLGSPLAGGA